ncbi:MAG TPA: aminotransferase class I/II-fold pyridoxal phosphate-dependent enzyme, partial [Bacillota bacterium]|nr:aminotransferase class I/II-fold pyridoxal phosphate-dependent enzyme [Bacillota bacterium]
MLDQQEVPLVQALEEYNKKEPVRFHVPGHKGRERNTGFFSNIYPYDVTEIPGLDDLHDAQEAILKAQQLAAEAFGADETFFLIGGSTVGNIAMVMAACHPGDQILVQRNVHKSVIHGLILARAKPIYLNPEIDRTTGHALTVSVNHLKKMLNLNPQVKAVFLSNPNYYGMGMRLRPYAELCNEYHIPLLVDEAHGAHMGFGSIPSGGMQEGATAVVQSTHKMLTSMTMSSMLHLKGDLLDSGRIRQLLAMLQSSSPSYPLMASLDLARREMATKGNERIASSLTLARQLVQGIKNLNIQWLQVVEQGNYDYLDPLKITLRTTACEFNGHKLKQFLEGYHIYPELADDRHVLLLLSVNTTKRDVQRTVEVISYLPKLHSVVGNTEHPIAHLFSQEVVLTPHEAFYRETKMVPWREAIGQICGELIA